MISLESTLYVLLALLAATIPFELQFFPILSSLQWLFVAIAAVSAPIIFRQRKRLLRDRFVLAAIAFVLIQWVAAVLAPEFTPNAIKGAIRSTAGLTLLCATLCLRKPERLLPIWAVSAVAAALYGILDRGGFGIAHLFRGTEYYVGAAVRLSGSFEYPNTAAAFFALSLPIVWMAPKSHWLRFGGSLLVCSALILTYSRGAVIAVLAMLAIWAATGRSASAFRLLCLFGGIFAASLILLPSLSERFGRSQPIKPLAAEYEPEFNMLRRPANEIGDLVVRIRNTGAATWSPSSEAPFALTYRWYDVEKKKLVPMAMNYTAIPGPLRPQESVALRATFITPPQAGLYLLTWDIFNPVNGWFSGRGVYPGLVEVAIQPGKEASSGHGDLSRWYRREISQLVVARVPFSRIELWKAALGMIRDHPILGMGPDNFRLLYGRQYHLDRWDTNIRANSLFLELLAGSGLAGLAAFCLMMSLADWRACAASLALGIFLIHGLVDVFLMTTPIYFAFWILLGQAHRTEATG